MTSAPGFTATAHHVALSVADLDAQQRWYAETLGMDVEQRFDLPEPPVRTVLLRTPRGFRIELIERAGSARAATFADALDAARARGYGHWAIEVDDLDLAYTELTRAGAAPVSPPAPAVQPGARFAYVKDPEGNLLELIQPAAPG
jgi:catechol 2,3-dioxygenase-like lactoylglutathione lyase family enzyme